MYTNIYYKYIAYICVLHFQPFCKISSDVIPLYIYISFFFFYHPIINATSDITSVDNQTTRIYVGIFIHPILER